MVRKQHHKVKEYVCNATCRLGDGQRVILRQRVRGSVRAVRAVRNTRVFLTEIRVVADDVDIFHMYAEMGNDERTEMQLKFQDSQSPSAFVTTPKVGRTGLNLTVPNHVVITQKFWVLNEQQQAIAWVIQLGQNRVAHTWLLNAGPGGYNNHTRDLK